MLFHSLDFIISELDSIDKDYKGTITLKIKYIFFLMDITKLDPVIVN